MLKKSYFTEVRLTTLKVVISLWMGALSLWAAEVHAQDAAVRTPVTGTVRSASGEALIGATVVVKGTTQGSTTDMEGNFKLNAASQDVLVFSYMGYVNQDMSVGSNKVFNITMVEDNTSLDAVVVTALGIKRAEKALSYNVQTVKGDELTTVKSANFMNALSGKVAGTQIAPSAGGPGSAVKVVARGTKLLMGDNNVMYVIDGVPMHNSSSGNTDAGSYSAQPGTEGIADINPEDIESISMLTGPSAAALYGYEGANGVVLITTKKGRADKTTLSVSNNTTFSSPLMMPKFQNRYGNFEGEARSWGDETSYRYDPVKFFNTGSNVSNNIALATGNDKSQSYFSVGNTDAKGILPNNTYNRYNFAFRNTTSFLKEKLVLDASLSYIIQKDKNMISQGQYFNPLPAVYLFPRNEDFNEIRLFERYDDLAGVPIQFWPYGDQGLDMQNPYWIMYRMNRESNKNRYILATSLKYNITKWFNVTGRVNVDNSNWRNTEKRHAGTLATFSGPKGYYRLDGRSERQTYADVIADVNKSFFCNKVNLHLNLGSSIKDSYMDSHSVMGNIDKITNWFTTENISRTNGFKMKDGGLRSQAQSVFGAAEIGYKGKIFLSLTDRQDWDSSLAGSGWGKVSFNYSSAGLSGVVSDMVTLPKWFTYLKARLSWTEVGRGLYASYLTKPYYEYDDQTNQYSMSTTMPYWFLQPYRTNSREAGLNMRFFKGSLRLDATWFMSNTLKQSFLVTIPPSSGYNRFHLQAGDVQNSGVELALGYDKTWNNFGWSSHLTYSFNENKIKKLYDTTNPMTGESIHGEYVDQATLGKPGSPFVRLTEGGTVGDIYISSDWKRDGNGYIYLDPKTYLPSMVYATPQKVGSMLAKSYAGWQNSFSYKGVTLSALINGRFGGLVVSNTQAFLDRYGVSEYSAKLRDAGGVMINNTMVSAKDYLNIVAADTGQGAHYVYDATNVRLGEVSVQYDLPRKWTKKVGVTVGLVGSNLAMIYCKAPFDPELVPSSGSTYYTGVDNFMQPSLKNYGFNVKLQF